MSVSDDKIMFSIFGQGEGAIGVCVAYSLLSNCARPYSMITSDMALTPPSRLILE